MAKDPAFIFYSSDFLTGTQFFDDEQTGKYIRLMCAQHQHGHLTQKQVSIILKNNDLEILEKFSIDEEGKYFNKKLDSVISERKIHSEKQKENIAKRWDKLNKVIPNEYQTDTNSIPNTYQSVTKPIPLEDEIEIEIEDEIVIKEEEKKGEILKVIIWPSFENFWDAYDKKIDRKDTIKKWEKLRQAEKEKILDNLPQYITATPDKQYRKNPETYLNDRAWENEIITTNGTTKINTARAGSSEANRDSIKQHAAESSRIFQLIASQNAS